MNQPYAVWTPGSTFALLGRMTSDASTEPSPDPAHDAGAADKVPEATATLLRDWHQGVNTKNLDAVLRLCTPDVLVRGPRGTGSGHDLMRSWLTRSGIQLELKALHVFGGGAVLAEQEATWPPGASDSAPTEPVACVTVFHVRDRQVSAVARYDSAAEARAEQGDQQGGKEGDAPKS